MAEWQQMELRKAMSKSFSHLLDASSVATFFVGVITAENFLMVMGGVASLMAAANHSFDLYRKMKGRK